MKKSKNNIDIKSFGNISLGACNVTLKKETHPDLGNFMIKISQGTSCRKRYAWDASQAKEIFDEECEKALKEHGPLMLHGKVVNE